MGKGESEKIVIMYVPCSTEDEAASIARVLLEERLIACANIYASRSLYVWQGALSDETEHVLIAKTLSSSVRAAVQRVEKLHSYDIPCVVTFRPDSVSDAYAAWVNDQVSPDASLSGASLGQGA